MTIAGLGFNTPQSSEAFYSGASAQSSAGASIFAAASSESAGSVASSGESAGSVASSGGDSGGGTICVA